MITVHLIQNLFADFHFVIFIKCYENQRYVKKRCSLIYFNFYIFLLLLESENVVIDQCLELSFYCVLRVI